MNDPHVESLTYDLVLLDDGATFASPAPVSYAGHGFRIDLADARLRSK